MTVTTTPVSQNPTTPITDIFIKTYPKDADYHRYCMASIEKFCTGFRNVTVVDDGDQPPPKPYLMQQRVKTEAPSYTDAEFILFTDSDTLFNQPVTPETFMVDGKPVWIYTPWTPELMAAVPWFAPMTEFAGEEPHAEMMRRQPFLIPRDALVALNIFCWGKHGKSIGDYIMSRSIFSEYNVIGHYCWRFMHDRFHWINSETDPLPPEYVRQFWSHDPIERNMPEIQRILT